MKKVLSILVLALVAVQFAFAGDVITQDAKQPVFHQTANIAYQDRDRNIGIKKL